jgi:hypothetical protein
MDLWIDDEVGSGLGDGETSLEVCILKKWMCLVVNDLKFVDVIDVQFVWPNA